MTVDGWLRAAVADVEARGLADVRPLVDALATAMRELRAAPWNASLDTDASASATAATAPPGGGVPEPGVASDRPSDGPAPYVSGARPASARSAEPADAGASTLAGLAGAALTPRPGIRELAARLRRREVTAVELTKAALGAIERHEPAINAFITVTGSLALAEAQAADARLAKGEATSLLCGVPVSLKDLIDLEGVPTTAA